MTHVIRATVTFNREASSGIYSPYVFAIGQLASEIPYNIICGTLFWALLVRFRLPLTGSIVSPFIHNFRFGRWVWGKGPWVPMQMDTSS